MDPFPERPKDTRLTPVLLLTLPLLTLACSSGSGTSPGGETTGTEEGEFAEAAFGYSDP